MTEIKQYFIYGIYLTYNKFLESNTNKTVEEILNDDNEIQGIFTGRNGDFIIIGKIIKHIDGGDNPQLMPEIDEESVRLIIKEKYRLIGEFNYYFVKK